MADGSVIESRRSPRAKRMGDAMLSILGAIDQLDGAAMATGLDLDTANMRACYDELMANIQRQLSNGRDD